MPSARPGGCWRCAHGRGDRARATADGRYLIIDGRRWRASDPDLSATERKELVRELMSARSAVGWAKRRGDSDAEKAARARVHAAKVALGERGPKWWEE